MVAVNDTVFEQPFFPVLQSQEYTESQKVNISCGLASLFFLNGCGAALVVERAGGGWHLCLAWYWGGFGGTWRW